MKTEDAHQIANPYILILLEKFNNKEYAFTTKYEYHTLGGILIAQEKELSFLDEISKWHEEFSVAYIKMVDNRREALKISCQDLRKVLK